MLRNLTGPIAVTVLLLSAAATSAAPVHGMRHVARRWHGYGFLPGYRSPGGSKRSRREIAGRSTGMAAPAFITDAGMAVVSDRAGPRPRSAMYGIAADRA